MMVDNFLQMTKEIKLQFQKNVINLKQNKSYK